MRTRGSDAPPDTRPRRQAKRKADELLSEEQEEEEPAVKKLSASSPEKPKGSLSRTPLVYYQREKLKN